LVWNDDALEDFDIYRINYLTPYFTSAPNLNETATNEFAKLRDRGGFRNYKSVHFIAHSMGGLITKSMILKLSRDDRYKMEIDKVESVIFLGTPAQGASLASLAYLFTENPQVRDIWPAHLNSYLQALEDQWVEFLSIRLGGGSHVPKVYCAYETQPMKIGWWPFKYDLLVVPREMASSRCDGGMQSMPFDHHGIVEATKAGEEPYAWVSQRISEIERSLSLLDEAHAALNSAQIAARQGKAAEARSLLKTSDDLFTRANHKKGHGEVLLAFAELDEQEGLDEHARNNYEAAKQFFAARGLYRGEAKALLGLGHLETMALNHRKAITYLTRAHNLSEIKGDLVGQADAVLALGELAYRQSDFNSGETQFLHARGLFQTANDRYGEAKAIMWLGNVYSASSKDAMAMSFYKKSLKEFQEANDIRMQIEVLNQMSACAIFMGEETRNYSDAKDLIKQALALEKDRYFPAEEASTLINSGHLHMNLNDDHSAKTDFEMALGRFTSTVRDPLQQAIVLFMLGQLAKREGNVEGARTAWEGIFEICTSAKCPNENRAASVSLSEYYKARDLERAKEFRYRAATLDEESGKKDSAGRLIEEARTLGRRESINTSSERQELFTK
jgi:tetratricopeptide (TPR) repeat protein